KILGSGSEEHAAQEAHGEAPAEGHGEASAVEAVFLPIPDMIVNLSAEGTKQNYLKLKVQLEVASESDKAAVEAVMPRVIDQFQTYLRELRPRDLRGSAGIYRLQMELLSRVNAAAAPTKVRDVLFQEILIQ
ncbi:MAG TPA: flagellar basal body-associated FliL family protein, partial [Alphaproteobacteria bacterium]|nr:flagellar basal body-associated FliL family protein [Alphaproteobacteria bacterium]